MFCFYVGVLPLLPACSLLALCQYIGAYTDLHEKSGYLDFREKISRKSGATAPTPDTLPMGPH